MNQYNYKIFDNVSLGASVNSSIVNLTNITIWSPQLVWTGGTVNGSFKIQVSNDPGALLAGVVSGVSNWSDYTGSSSTASGAGDLTYNVNIAAYRWARIAYTRTSGTGTVNGYVNAKA